MTETPQQMADWLADHWDVLDDCELGEEKTMAIAAYLRKQPTDAQKIEALKLASDAAVCGMTGLRFWTQKGQGFRAFAHEAGTSASAAMRLLGLDPEAP